MDLKLLSKQVSDLSKEVGKLILAERQGFNSTNIETKGKNDFVTHVDKMAEEAIIKSLKGFLPEAGIIAEESGKDEKEHFNWIIDPLDGTTNFIHGIPTFCVSIALKHDSEIVLGVVYEINGDECFSAIKDGGSFLNGEKISVTNTKQLPNALIATGFPYTKFDLIEPYMATFKEMVEKSRGVRRLGSAAADLAYVACGRFDGFFEYGLNAWDVAAGSLIVIEAGGMVTDFKESTNYLWGGEIIATNNKTHLETSKIISSHFF
ncbi:MAG: inositol monophosphatase [Flavobacteriales bacterium]|nr:inositol monophosphatase [Flavobacteriales bacterium]